MNGYIVKITIMKFNNLWKKVTEIDEIDIKFQIGGLIFIGIELDWSLSWASFTILNFNWCTR